MAKQVMQFRYYQDGDEVKNCPTSITAEALTSGKVFEDYLPIIQLGIQSLPGTEFYLNNSYSSIVIGSTGIYELDLEGYTEITNLKFDIKSIERIAEGPSAYLIIDIISDLEEVE